MSTHLQFTRGQDSLRYPSSKPLSLVKLTGELLALLRPPIHCEPLIRLPETSRNIHSACRVQVWAILVEIVALILYCGGRQVRCVNLPEELIEIDQFCFATISKRAG